MLGLLRALDQTHVERVAFIGRQDGRGRVAEGAPQLARLNAAAGSQTQVGIQRAIEIDAPALDGRQRTIEFAGQRRSRQQRARLR